MSKFALFGILMLWLIFATFLVNAFDTYLDDDTFSVDNPIGEVSTEGGTDIGTIRAMSLTFVNAISLNVNGLPNIFALIFFTIPTFIIAFMTLELLIKMLGAILPF